jgi:hypothetical protein
MAVRLAQKLLNSRLRRVPGFHRLREDGAYGLRTSAAVAEFQRANHISLEHGVIGTVTWRALGLTVEIDHTVHMRAQHYDLGCWNACASMILDRDMSVVTHGAELSAGFGLMPDIDNVTTFVGPFRWQVESPPSDVRGLARILAGTPIWIGGGVLGEGGQGGHVVVISGAWGDGTNYGTIIRIHDPWPVNRGAITYCSYPYMTAMEGMTFDPLIIAGPF